MSIELKAPDFGELISGMELLSLPPARKRRMLARLGRMVIAQAKKNVAEQKTVEGSPFVPRKDGSGKKMLTGLVRSKWLGVKVTGEEEATVFYYAKKMADKVSGQEVWRNQGAVANKHQKGGAAAGWPRVRAIRYAKSEIALSRTLERKQGSSAGGFAGCSAPQAAMLIRLDYLPKQLAGHVPAGAAGVRFVMQQVSRGAARALLDRGIAKRGSTMVPDRTPARPFLGAGSEARKVWAEAILRDLSGSFRAKNFQGLLQ